MPGLNTNTYMEDAADKLVNRVAKSPLKTINLEDFFPTKEIVELDLTEYLFKGLLLKEKEFRQSIKNLDVSVFEDKYVCIICTSDAIIPVWAYMLVAVRLSEIARDIYMGSKEQFLSQHYQNIIQSKDWNSFADQMIVVKGCSNKPVPASAYMNLTKALYPFVKSIMYGEPCSTVPVYKRRKK